MTTDQPTRVPLIDEYLPAYDWSERHSITIFAPASVVYGSLRTADFAESPIVRGLLGLRALPARLSPSAAASGGRGSEGQAFGERQRRARTTLDSFRKSGFTILAEKPYEELLIGLVGRFWTIHGGICETDSARFRSPMEPGTARAAWNFALTPLLGGESTLLMTETRIQAADTSARMSFSRYWLLIRPFSGLIRRLMLRAIRDEAESASSAGTRQ